MFVNIQTNIISLYNLKVQIRQRKSPKINKRDTTILWSPIAYAIMNLLTKLIVLD